MSNDALTWAWEQRTGSATRKAVLVALAERENGTRTAFPSIAQIEFDTELNTKTVKKVLRELERAGFIRDTGKRAGRSRQVVVYELIGLELRSDRAQKRTGPKKGPGPDLPDTEPNSGRGTGPKSGPRNPKGNPKGTHTTGGKDRYPDWFEQLWDRVPRRSGSNSKKQAYGCVNARLREGWTLDAIEGGLERYAAFCAATGKIDTEKVMQARTFFGPEDPPHFTNDWQLPADHGSAQAGSATETVAERMARRERERQQEAADG